ncbi:hypothetical protein Hypma_000610 [Hypsizygus marmoreus]|uniref:Uncharacterized protein n=1 Tax=Hypsizygus marmoreus TaxID=39966 RepID=A0A369J884_HYPMA|nr:hypothetical protein Hypma_000610 [Hypsizygus marmoreus]
MVTPASVLSFVTVVADPLATVGYIVGITLLSLLLLLSLCACVPVLFHSSLHGRVALFLCRLLRSKTRLLWRRLTNGATFLVHSPRRYLADLMKAT